MSAQRAAAPEEEEEEEEEDEYDEECDDSGEEAEEDEGALECEGPGKHFAGLHSWKQHAAMCAAGRALRARNRKPCETDALRGLLAVPRKLHVAHAAARRWAWAKGLSAQESYAAAAAAFAAFPVGKHADAALDAGAQRRRYRRFLRRARRHAALPGAWALDEACDEDAAAAWNARADAGAVGARAFGRAARMCEELHTCLMDDVSEEEDALSEAGSLHDCMDSAAVASLDATADSDPASCDNDAGTALLDALCPPEDAPPHGVSATARRAARRAAWAAFAARAPAQYGALLDIAEEERAADVARSQQQQYDSDEHEGDNDDFETHHEDEQRVWHISAALEGPSWVVLTPLRHGELLCARSRAYARLSRLRRALADADAALEVLAGAEAAAAGVSVAAGAQALRASVAAHERRCEALARSGRAAAAVRANSDASCALRAWVILQRATAPRGAEENSMPAVMRLTRYAHALVFFRHDDAAYMARLFTHVLPHVLPMADWLVALAARFVLALLAAEQARGGAHAAAAAQAFDAGGGAVAAKAMADVMLGFAPAMSAPANAPEWRTVRAEVEAALSGAAARGGWHRAAAAAGSEDEAVLGALVPADAWALVAARRGDAAALVAAVREDAASHRHAAPSAARGLAALLCDAAPGGTYAAVCAAGGVGALCAALAASAARSAAAGADAPPLAYLRATHAQPFLESLTRLVGIDAAAAAEARAAGALASCFATLEDVARGGRECNCTPACLVIGHICMHATAANGGFFAAGGVRELGGPAVARAMRAALSAPCVMTSASSAAAVSSVLNVLMLGRAAPPGTRATLLADGGAAALAAALRAARLGLLAAAVGVSASAHAGAGDDDAMTRVCVMLLDSVAQLCAADDEPDADALDAAVSDDALCRLGSAAAGVLTPAPLGGHNRCADEDAFDDGTGAGVRRHDAECARAACVAVLGVARATRRRHHRAAASADADAAAALAPAWLPAAARVVATALLVRKYNADTGDVALAALEALPALCDPSMPGGRALCATLQRAGVQPLITAALGAVRLRWPAELPRATALTDAARECIARGAAAEAALDDSRALAAKAEAEAQAAAERERKAAASAGRAAAKAEAEARRRAAQRAENAAAAERKRVAKESAAEEAAARQQQQAEDAAAAAAAAVEAAARAAAAELAQQLQASAIAAAPPPPRRAPPPLPMPRAQPQAVAASGSRSEPRAAAAPPAAAAASGSRAPPPASAPPRGAGAAAPAVRPPAAPRAGAAGGSAAPQRAAAAAAPRAATAAAAAAPPVPAASGSAARPRRDAAASAGAGAGAGGASAAAPVAYPERPGKRECAFYMRTGSCKFGKQCMFHHPPRGAPGGVGAAAGGAAAGGAAGSAAARPVAAPPLSFAAPPRPPPPQQQPGQAQQPSAPPPEECCLCMDCAPSVRLQPCAHRIMCLDCTLRVVCGDGLCPVCRCHIENFQEC
jgi:hypothetical protein